MGNGQGLRTISLAMCVSYKKELIVPVTLQSIIPFLENRGLGQQ